MIYKKIAPELYHAAMFKTHSKVQLDVSESVWNNKPLYVQVY